MYVESRIPLEGFNKREIQVFSHKRSECEVMYDMDINGAIAGDRSAINMYTSSDCSRMVHFIFARIFIFPRYEKS